MKENDINELVEEAVDIGSILDSKEFGPEPRQLQTYLNQTVVITDFREVKSKIKKHEDRVTVEIDLIDESGKMRQVVTAAANLVSQLNAIRDRYGFTLPDAGVRSVRGKLIADRSFGKYRNFRLKSAADTDETSADDGEIEEEED